MHSAYRDDREAALTAAEILRRENDELQRENRYLRNLLDPDGLCGSRAQAVAQLQGALGATTLLLGALAGAVFVSQQGTAETGCSMASAPTPREVSVAVLRGGDPVDGDGPAGEGGEPRLQGLVAFDVVSGPTGAAAETPRTASAEAPDAEAVTTLRLRVAYAEVLPAVARCFSGQRARVQVTVDFDQAGAVASASVVGRRGLVTPADVDCVHTASLAARLGGQRAPSVSARYVVDVRHGAARLRRVHW